MFFGRNDAKAETPVLWPPHVKSWLIGKDSDAGRDWGQEEKGRTEDEMAGWHHRLDGREFEWTPGVGDGQGGLACCGSWGHKEFDTTEWLNWTELKMYIRLKEQGDSRNQWIQIGGRSQGFCVSLCILNFILKVMSSSSRCVCLFCLSMCERESVWGEKRCYHIYIFKVNWRMNWKMQEQKEKDQLGSYHDTSF